MKGSMILSLITPVLASKRGDGTTELCNETRTYNGRWNNCDQPSWGSTNSRQIRFIAQDDYSDGISEVTEDGRPSAREVTTEIFSKVPVSGSPKSALFVAWGQLVSFDLFKNSDNTSEPFNILCQTRGNDDEGEDHGEIDIWCPFGDESDSIPFYRSEAELDSKGVRQPLNYATAYLDLDFVYGRTEGHAKQLREIDKGMMKLNGSLPERFENGSWLVADNRTTQFPVTFALHTMFLIEHNRCCEEVELRFDKDDEAIFQACRANTIAAYQHITRNDFAIRLLNMDVVSAYDGLFNSSSSSSPRPTRSLMENDDSKDYENVERGRDKDKSLSGVSDDFEVVYDASIQAGADVFFSTVGAAAFHAAIPPTVRIMGEGYNPRQQDGIELIEAVENLEAIFRQPDGVATFIRGAAISPSLAIDAHFASTVSTVSRLFKLPIDGIQRGRDHGIPNYNDARAAYNLSRATSFANITSNKELEKKLRDVYDNDISKLDALTGALAESNQDAFNKVFGELLAKVWGDQMYRTMTGDRFWHNISDALDVPKTLTLKELVRRSINVTDLSDSPFVVPEVMVCYENCGTGSNLVALSSEFSLRWDLSNDEIKFTLYARRMGDVCYLGIGFGGTTMTKADDYLVCTVDGGYASCVDRAPVSSRTKPRPDRKNSTLDVIGVSVETEVTSVTFTRRLVDLDDEDYNIFKDIEKGVTTEVIFAYNDGEFGLHPNANRGAANVDFSQGTSSKVCEEDRDFFLLHGALILIAWMFFATAGIYYARYCKGEMVLWGSQWWQRHAGLMIVASELVLPLSITAIFSTQDNFSTSHARWGLYMIAGIILQLVTGWLRAKALEGKQHNFSLFHRINKYVHIWCGRFAYLAGIVECYHGLKLVSTTDNLVFTTYDINYEIGSFGDMHNIIFPLWVGVIFTVFLLLEARIQVKRYKTEGATRLFGIFFLKNNAFIPGENGEGRAVERRMMARTNDLPLYHMEQFNYKVLNGESWVIVDGAILDVSTFYGRHPGGSRIIMNALGTDITGELLGEDRSIGNAVSSSPQHAHSKDAWGIARTLVVGYIHEGEHEVDYEREDRDSDHGEFDWEKENEDHIHQDANIHRDQTREASSRDGLAALKTWGANDRSKPFNLSERRGFTLDFTADGSPGLALTAASRSTASVGMSKATTRSVAITRAWEEKARRNRATGANTESPARLLQRSTSLVPGFSGMQVERGKFILERYHVCRFVLRERLDNDPDSVRPVYRYVFACPGEAAALAKAISGVCHFNMRLMRQDRQTLVQRSYNASAVRIVEVPLPAKKLETASPFPFTSSARVGARKSSEESSRLPVVNESQQEEENDLENRTTTQVSSTSSNTSPGYLFSRSSDQQPLAPRVTTGTSSLDGPIRRRVLSSSVSSWLSPAFARRGDSAVTEFEGIISRRPSASASPDAGDSSTETAEHTALKVVPADESPYGELCVEMRIKLYPHGAMSKLLERLAAGKDNATVQLQGPFPAEKLGAPPAYPNVVMIAAGTGINPMIQLIRDYRSFESANGFSSEEAAKQKGSRMSLIWQVAKPSEFYCLEELESLEAKMRGRLEITTFVNCDDGRLANGLAPPMSFLRPRNKWSSRPMLEDTYEEKTCDVEHHNLKNIQGVNRASSFFLSNSTKDVESPQKISGRSSVHSKGNTGVYSFALEERSTEISTEKSHGPIWTSGKSAEEGIAIGAQQRRLAQGKRRKYFVDGVDAKASELVVISPGGSSRTIVQSDSSVKGIKMKGRSSFFQQSWGKSRKREASKMPDAPISQPRRTDREGRKANAEQFALNETTVPKPVTRRAQSMGNLIAETNRTCRPSIGKVTKVHLKDALGDELVRELEELKKQRRHYRASSAQRADEKADTGAFDISAEYMSAMTCGCGRMTNKLQVVVSGPGGFVFKVEAMLDEIGVPPEAIVSLD